MGVSSLLFVTFLGAFAGACGGEDDGQPGPSGGSGAGGEAGETTGGTSGIGGVGGEAGETTGGTSGIGGVGGEAGSSGDGPGGEGGGGEGGAGEAGSGATGGMVGGAGMGGTFGGAGMGGTFGGAGMGGTFGGAGTGGGGGEQCGDPYACPCLKVSPTGNDASAVASDGAAAFLTIDAAVDFGASRADLPKNVCVSEGSYLESPSIPAGISVYGGFEGSVWTRTGGATTVVPQLGPVLFEGGASVPSRLDGVTIDFSAVDSAVDVVGRRVFLSNVVVASRVVKRGQAIVDASAGADLTISNLELDAALLAVSSSLPPAPPGAYRAAFGIRAVSSRLTLDDSTVAIQATGDGTVHAVYLENAPSSQIRRSDVAISAPPEVAGDLNAVRALGDLNGFELSDSVVTATLGDHAAPGAGASPEVIAVNLSDCTAGAPSIANNHSIEAESFDENALLFALRADGACPDGTSCGVEPRCFPRIDGNAGIVARGGDVSVGIGCHTGSARSDCAIVGNADVHTSGATSGTAVECDWCTSIEDNVLTGAIDENGAGGPPSFFATGLDLLGAARTLVRGNRISGGCGTYSTGAILGAGPATRFENNVIRGFYGPETCGFVATAFAVVTQAGGDFNSNVIDGGGSTNPCIAISASSETGAFRNNVIRGGSCDFPQPLDIPVLRQHHVAFEFNDLVRAATTAPPGTVSSHNFTDDPGFVDYPSDLHLRSDSPCIDAGTSFDAPSDDLEGRPRDPKPDVGVYERGGSTSSDPCAGMTCGGDGTCDWFGDHAACVCRDSNGGAPAAPSAECGARTCLDARGACDPLTTCTDVAEGRVCSACPLGYVGSGETGCQQPNPCFPNPCLRGECTVVEGAPACTCPPGIAGTRCDVFFGSPAAGAAHVCTSGSPARCWGLNTFGQATPPAGPFVDVAGGDRHTCAVQGSGYSGPVVCWGDDRRGQSSPPSGTFLTLAAGREHTCALGADHGVTCWGNDDDGQASAPPGQFVAVAAGARNSCAVRMSDGRIRCWGSNAAGQSSPGDGTFASISLGDSHGCGRRSGSYVLECWGDDAFGQTSLAPLGFGYLGVKLRANRSCVQTSDDRAECWGDDAFGQSSPPATRFYYGFGVGDAFGCGMASDRHVECWGSNSFGEHVGPGGAFVSVSASHSHACSVSANGSVSCWGSNDAGESSPPAGIFKQVAAGDRFTCGRRSDDTLACWGGNGVGDAPVPSGPFVQIVAGGAHACALRWDGNVTCFGSNESGQSSWPGNTVVALAAGENHSCGLFATGPVVCWGDTSQGQATPPSATFKAIAAAANHTCGLLRSGGVVCWGGNDTGGAAPTSGSFASIAAGVTHDCAIGSDGSLTCWGHDSYGELEPPSGTFRAVTTGNAGETCAIHDDRSLSCWGALVR